MCVDIGGCSVAAVSQPILNILHRDSVFRKQGCARISGIVETNRTKAVLLQDPFEMVGHKIRLIWDTQLVDIDVLRLRVAVSAELFTSGFPFLHPQQKFPVLGNRRHRSAAGFVFHPVLAIGTILDHGMIDRESISLKVDCASPQSHNPTSTQAVERSHQDRKFYRISLHKMSIKNDQINKMVVLMHVYSLHTEPACKSKYALVLHFCFSQKGKPFTSSNGSFDRKVTRVWRNSYA